MKVTIKMVAEKCNVSPVTVSRVLANHSSVNEKTRETVLNVKEELGYRSKKVEKLMDKKESRYIAVMIEDITQSANCIIQAAANYLRGENYLPIVCETGEKAVYLETYLTNLDKDGLLAGCIVISSQGARAELAKWQRSSGHFLWWRFIGVRPGPKWIQSSWIITRELSVLFIIWQSWDIAKSP